MWRLLHLLIVALYLALPLGMILVTFLRRPTREIDAPSRAARIGGIAVTFLAALAIALSLCLIYGRALQATVPVGQVLLATYFAAAMLLLLRGFDAGLLWLLRRGLRVHRRGELPTAWRGVRVLFMYLARTVILLAVGLPYVMASVMVYRPRVTPRDDPRSQLGFTFQRVEFPASDGVRLAGWWLPAGTPPRSRADDPHWGRRTVVLCHGLASNKSNQLILGRRLVPEGFNVLAFDFRAHGESAGQLTSFGALEARDVLGAVRWIRDAHPEQADKIYGVGASMGAAALIAAAADPGPDGQAIAAIATYAAYDDLDLLIRDLTRDYFEQPLRWLLDHVGVPLASAQVGVDLRGFAPARRAPDLWPRPILFIHGHRDEIIPFERGRALHDAAAQPRYHLWFGQGTHNDIVSDEQAARIVAEFFRTAAPIPVI